jgi:hypothetical protein
MTPKSPQQGVMVLRNKDMTPYSPDVKLSSIARRAEERDEHIQAIQTHKKAMVQQRTSYRQQLIDEKYRRLEVRRNREVRPTQQTNRVVKTWSVLMCLVATAKQLKTKLMIRQVRRR